MVDLFTILQWFCLDHVMLAWLSWRAIYLWFFLKSRRCYMFLRMYFVRISQWYWSIGPAHQCLRTVQTRHGCKDMGPQVGWFQIPDFVRRQCYHPGGSLRQLCFTSMHYNLELHVSHIPGVDNVFLLIALIVGMPILHFTESSKVLLLSPIFVFKCSFTAL